VKAKRSILPLQYVVDKTKIKEKLAKKRNCFIIKYCTFEMIDKKTSRITGFIVLILANIVAVTGFVLPLKLCPSSSLKAVQIEGYEDAFQIIDQCSTAQIASDDLYDAVRFIDRNAFKIYPTLEDKQALWDQAHGSWKLQLATGGGKYRSFKPIPIFAFAMIDETNFGNGIGFNEKSIWLSLLGPHIFNEKQRRMFITIDDMFLGGYNVSNFVPDFIKDGIGLGKKPEDFKKPPAFTYIGVSDKSLVARGGTGGIALWTRLDKDIRPSAYPE
jgi:hypothetical protein